MRGPPNGTLKGELAVMQTMQGILTPAAARISGDITAGRVYYKGSYIHTQSREAATWIIAHNLGRYPSVTVVDSENIVVLCDMRYSDRNTIILSFTSPLAGAAYLN